MHILVGDRDAYDAPDSCRHFTTHSSRRCQRHFAVTVYPGATFAWDSRFSSNQYARAVARGKGGPATTEADAATASRSRAFAVDYFTRHLQP